MNELYELIEKKIKASGYPRPISGADVYDDICDQIDGKENGTYLLLSKFEEDVVFEYHITIRDEDFNLGVLTMKTPEGTFEVDFDAQIYLGFNLLTGEAASQSLKETIDKDYCECGMPLETVRESEAPLKERSERV